MTLYDWCVENNQMELLNQWHPTKNGEKNPKNVSAHNGNKYWWIFPYDDPNTGKHFDFEWQSTVAHRVEGLGCPYFHGYAVWPGFNDFETLQPELAKEWHPTKNGDLRPSDVTEFSGEKVWWLYSYDDPITGKHFDFEWIACVRDRACGNGCPYLSGKAIYVGFNDLQTRYPEIAKEWHPTKNGTLKPTDVTPYSQKKVWWLYPYDDPITGKHYDLEWESTVGDRVSGSNCPYLSGKKVLKGFNDLVARFPEIAKEWHPTKNGAYTPDMFTSSSNKVFWWIGRCGHEWKTAITARTSGRNCPYCAGKLLPGFNDLETWCKRNNRELLLEEWDYSKNTIKPSETTSSPHRKVWWKCKKCGYEWKAEIGSRKNGIGCPECGKKKLAEAQSKPNENNNLEVWCKEVKLEELLQEWDYKKNKILPSEVCRSSTFHKVWWKCNNCGHEWQSTPASRIRILKNGKYTKSTCPKCIKAARTSFPEQAIYYYLKQAFPDAINSDRKALGRKELDIYIPSRKTAIEYDGYAWHSNTKRDDEKNRCCIEKGIQLIRVRENGCPENADPEVQYFSVEPNDNTELNQVIGELIKRIEPGYDHEIHINVDDDRDRIIDLYFCGKRELSVASLFPELISEWHPTKNGKLTPDLFTCGSKERVWWRCSDCGYEWETKINCRTRSSRPDAKCPVCSKKKMAVGFNDLETWCKKSGHEYLLAEWVYEKNEIMPSQINISSPKKVWWECPKCKSLYLSSIGNRTGKGKGGCPYCAGMQVKHGLNDFETWCKKNNRLELLEQWDYDKNEKLPSEYSHGSGKKVWWKCPKCKESWFTNIDNREKGRGCPVCAGRDVRTGINDFAKWCKDNNKEILLEEWDYSKNTITPDKCYAGTQKNIWWVCSKCGHQWQNTPYRRRMGKGCPHCAGYRDIINTDTGKVFPSIAEAKRFYNIPNAHIHECLKGIRKKAGGYHWEYAD